MVVILFCVGATVAASYIYPLPSYVKSRGVEPASVASVDLTLESLSCRGRANLLFYFLERDDMFELSGYFRLEAWPGPGEAEIRVWHDPSKTDELRIKEAITEPYYELDYGWRESPFIIKGYDMLGLALEPLEEDSLHQYTDPDRAHGQKREQAAGQCPGGADPRRQ